ncbi:sugar transferase [Macrococcus equipercicus]|uniref:Sugar transferase n=1 Tax=Macrococcus equipercicus TaxID=69967 RepID=A0ABQ6R8J9_9STAP|nr:sugar transferase [Macrococcus equipercicus]KAA1039427.1 sugar transferase [Macrococcus equipercicus]
MKRSFDLSSSLVGLAVISPVLVVTAIAIKADSKGPILFKQQRPGLDNKLFTIYKFRSMAVDTPNIETAKLGEGVSYITPVGKFIRKTSIDELPQLINVAKGEMSIVGPRPALYNQYELIEKRTALGIHKVKPGITGYAQVMGRDEISDDEKVRYDKYYVDHQSFMFDMWIIWETIKGVVTSKGVSH